MIPIDFQVSRSKVKVKGHAGLLHLVQLITQERFAPEASHLVGIFMPPFEKGGHIALHVSVGMSVALNLVQLITQ